MRIRDYLNFIVRIKKKIFPTRYDRFQRKLFEERMEFYGQFVKEGDLCFDIGANYGNRTEVFLKLKARVVALEPQSKCYLFLKKKYASNIDILQKGAGAKNEFLDFYINEKNSPVSTFSKEWIKEFKDTRFAGGEWNKIERIEVVTLDYLINQYGRPKFIKIDVEGFELEVLKGLNTQVPFLSFEFAIPERLNVLAKCLQLIASKNENSLVNYAREENANWELDEWMTIKEMLEYIHTEQFLSAYAGDIYIRSSIF